MYEDKRA